MGTKGNLLIAQSGGPTAAINATIAGALEMAYTSSKIGKVYGGINGIEGILKENLVDMSDYVYNEETMQLLYQTPAAVLGSCRFKLDDFNKNPEQYSKLIDIFRKFDIKYFVYTGGNDSMDTVDKLSKYLELNNISDIYVMGAPKTIDNDLAETDHCPGFGSAAKYIATTIAEIERDCTVYDMNSVTIVEIMGRNTGWLTASSALARLNGGKGPSLIYLCEVPLDQEKFVRDVKAKLASEKSFLIAVSEGLKGMDGKYISESVQSGPTDMFGHKIIAGAGRVLEDIIKREIGCKTRTIELNLMQRAASHITSRTDLAESSMLGKKAVQCALDGITGHMATIIREKTECGCYSVNYSSAPAKNIANHEKTVPMEWIDVENSDIKEEAINYMKPLIQGERTVVYENGIPKHLRIRK